MDGLTTIHSMPTGTKLLQVFVLSGTLGDLAVRGSSADRAQSRNPGLTRCVITQAPEAASVSCCAVTDDGRLVFTGSGDCASVYHINY